MCENLDWSRIQTERNIFIHIYIYVGLHHRVRMRVRNRVRNLQEHTGKRNQTQVCR
jgi:hypothetical protein